MKKQIFVCLAVFCLVVSGAFCKGSKNESAKTDFATKIYAEDSPFGYSISFVDSDFCVMGLACCNYKFNKKTNVLTVIPFANLGMETMTFTYDAATDSFKNEDDAVLNYSEQMGQLEIENAYALKKAMSE